MAQRVNSFVSTLGLEFHQNNDQSFDRPALFDNNVFNRLMRRISEVFTGIEFKVWSHPGQQNSVQSQVGPDIKMSCSGFDIFKKTLSKSRPAQTSIYIYIYNI